MSNQTEETIKLEYFWSLHFRGPAISKPRGQGSAQSIADLDGGFVLSAVLGWDKASCKPSKLSAIPGELFSPGKNLESPASPLLTEMKL